jgi:HPt (histidine-containing phosphotransfer) domain-containing protein
MEIFDKEALLASVDGDILDAKELVETCVSEMRGHLRKLREDIAAKDFPGIMMDAANIHGIAVLLESKAIMRTSERIASMSIARSIDEIAKSFEELERLLEHLDASFEN